MKIAYLITFISGLLAIGISFIIEPSPTIWPLMRYIGAFLTLAGGISWAWLKVLEKID